MKAFVFDMDDTLYKEHRYRDSGYRTVARHYAATCGVSAEALYRVMTAAPERAFETVSELASTRGVAVSVDEQLNVYRSHHPDITLDADAEKVLAFMRDNKVPTGLITDGRAIGQLNKISALGLDRFIDVETIMPTVLYNTDKHSAEPFRRMETLLRQKGASTMVYVGDNPSKDFCHPNMMGWQTVMLRDYRQENIHKQILTDWPAENSPRVVIDTLTDLLRML